MKSNRSLLTAGLAGLAAVATYAVFVEPRWIQVTRPRVHVRGLPPGLEGLRIALLTDMHADPRSLSVIRRACRAAMQEKPDLIALTGDFAADDAPNFRAVLDALSNLNAPLGVYAVPGNHDYRVGIDLWHDEVRQHPVIQDLTNRALLLRVNGARLCVAGVDDFTYGAPSLEALPPPEQRDFTVLLAHDPDQGEQSRRGYDQVDLILSGHTHGGQVRLPWIGAVLNPAVHDDIYEQGLRRRPWTQVYTSRGVGTVHLQLRFLCRPEVAILELTSDVRPEHGNASRSAQKMQ